MIYDRVLRIYSDGGGTPLHRRLTYISSHFYAPKEVFAARYWDSVQAGSRVDQLVELHRDDSLTATLYAVPEDGHVYRIVQVQQGSDRDGLPVSVLSLQRAEDHFDIGIPDEPEGGDEQ